MGNESSSDKNDTCHQAASAGVERCIDGPQHEVNRCLKDVRAEHAACKDRISNWGTSAGDSANPSSYPSGSGGGAPDSRGVQLQPGQWRQVWAAGSYRGNVPTHYLVHGIIDAQYNDSACANTRSWESRSDK